MMTRGSAVRSVVWLAVISNGLALAVPPKRAPRDIEADLNKTTTELEGKHFPGDVVNPKYRRSLTDQAVPVLKQRLGLLKELAAVSPVMANKARWGTAKTQAMLAFYKDADAASALKQQAEATTVADATAAKLAQQVQAWWEATGKSDAQGKVLDAVVALAADQPKEDSVALALKTMIDDNPASTALAGRAWDAIAPLKSAAARELNATPNKVGKPLAITGALVNGKTFNSTQWKGKVVVVDFWATWCPPCREEIPKIAKLYADYHDKGLEIVGVSSDQTRGDLVDFLKQHPEMPWPQLFAGGQSWHPLTKKFGIDSIPRVYVIDRDGVLVSTTARGKLENLVPDLLNIDPAKRELPPEIKAIIGQK